MNAPLLSADWYRVSFMRPRLRAGVRVTHQMVRGEAWRVAQDTLSGRQLRFNRVAWMLVAGCDGRRTLDDIWSALVDAEGDAAPTQAEAIDIIGQAYGGHLLLGDIPPDAAAIVRVRSRDRQRRRRQAVNPLAIRLPLWDPDMFLSRYLGSVRWLFSRASLFAMAALIVVSALLLLAQGGEFARAAHRVLTESPGLLLLWLVFPLVKGLHELAHAFAVKRYGGEVHQIGIALLMLTPVPFVDASASASFASKYQRALVAGAGILTELVLAGMALIAWCLLEPGLLRDVAASIVMVGGVSTLLVNGNPLLRFDGYHVLCDVFELPNLAQRSLAWWLHILRRHLLGLTQDRFSSLARGERRWLIAYAPAAWLMRTLMLVTLAVALTQILPWASLILALAALWLSLGLPLFRALRWLVRSPMLGAQRPRAMGVLLAGAGLVCLVAFVLPLPLRSHAPGIVWLPDEAMVRLQVGGFVDEFMVSDGDAVQAGAPLARLSNPALQVALAKSRSEWIQADVRQAQQRDTDPLVAAQARDQANQLREEVLALQVQQDALLVRAGTSGRVAFDVHRDLVGIFLPQGHLLAQVVPDAAPVVRALVSNSDVGLVRDQSHSAAVKLAGGGETMSAQMRSAVPQASTALPSAALGQAYGGSIALDPMDKSGQTARDAHFQVDLQLPDSVRPPIGSRVLVTFNHGQSSGAQWLSRLVRRAFLRHLDL